MVFRKFLRDTHGSTAVLTGVMAIPLMLAIGIAVDYTILSNIRASLQQAVDSAALASVRELGLSSTRGQTAKTVAESYFEANLSDLDDVEATKIDVQLAQTGKAITVTVSYVWKPFLVHYIDTSALPIEVSATAALAGETSLCVLALDSKSDRAIDLGGNDGHISAENCIVHSNSTSSRGISVFKKSTLRGEYIASAGGFQGAQYSFTPLPITDSPQIDDPLMGRKPPTFGPCDYKNFNTPKNSTALQPGVYCGGLFAGGNTIAKLSPGDYIIKDGPLSVQGNASLIGDDVGFYFTGTNATFDFGVSTQVNLTARKSGPLAGILFFEDRASPTNRQFTIRSKDAERFEGTIYLPNGRLWIDKASRVGQQSNWTAIIANQIAIGNGPKIVINSDYSNSSIPVPDGISSGQDVRLTQ